MAVSRRPDPGFWSGRRVFVTGHTGFKGTWVRLWLTRLGAEVSGYALAPDTTPSLHQLVAGVGKGRETIADVRDGDALAAAIRQADPEIVLHMAAQALVRRGYADPVTTFDVNVVGTVRVLEAARAAPSLKAVLVVTTDKVYRNDEGGRAFHEDDPLGGHDPYAASKAGAEYAAAAYAASYFRPRGVPLATARGGNVIGGGDFSADRLVPDVVRAALAGQTLDVRNPDATRPWQHVLDCLNGYFLFLEALHAGLNDRGSLNFGPLPSEPPLAVREVVAALQEAMGLAPEWRETSAAPELREMQVLGLDPARAEQVLGWRPYLSQREAVAWTAEWYTRWRRGEDAAALVVGEIDRFMGGA